MIDVKGLGSVILRNYFNFFGSNVSKKILVIESDDWGSIRMPSQEVYRKFVSKGFGVERSQYNRYDALESNTDLEALFEVLHRHRDTHNRPVVVTANMLVANPDFEKIRASKFQQYVYETVQSTLRHYPEHDRVFSLYQQGLKAGIFKPQFHGREHVQVNRWLAALRKGGDGICYAFDCRTTYSGYDDYNFMESFDWDSPEEVAGQQEIIQEGLQMFEENFGYKSVSFIAPCYTWDSRIEPALVKAGVRYMQGGRTQYVPKGGFNNYDKKRLTMGGQRAGLIYLTRNVFFEPSLVAKSDWVDYTLAGIRDAFRWNKPAIVCAHRINFIGFIDEANRTRNLSMLDELLRRVLVKWPDVEFISSDELGELISASPQP